ncbi:MAG: lactate dehydrogenase [marine bacterium B5-7]|nr:MAG: lactate dehydrogenase [marine bacterium B5-7]
MIETLEKALCDSQLLTSPEDCIAYDSDTSSFKQRPQAVVLAGSHDDVVRTVQFCRTHHIPLTARGYGTGTPGGAVPARDGIVIAFDRMHDILDYAPSDRYITVQPGCLNQAVQDHVKPNHLRWAPDPGSADKSSVGGNLAYNAAGPCAVKYGACRENVLRLKAVTGTGDTIETGSFTTKHAVGYDLTRLLIGSEGTLALITEATLKLIPLPAEKRSVRLEYADIHHAAAAIEALLNLSNAPCALEFMDEKTLGLLREYSDVSVAADVKAMLLVSVEDEKHRLDEALNAVNKAANNTGLLRTQISASEKDEKNLWQARRALSPCLPNVAPKKINEDVVVPVSKIPALVAGIEQLAEKFQLIIISFGHAGNGNLHVNLMVHPDDADEMTRATQCLDALFDLVLSLKGSLSGEHGVGLAKRPFISREIDPVTLSLMHQIKRVFDPDHILNPGKAI